MIMNIAYKNNQQYKYMCDVCGTQFNWNKQSSYYGKQDESEAVFCSKDCRDIHKKLINKKS